MSKYILRVLAGFVLVITASVSFAQNNGIYKKNEVAILKAFNTVPVSQDVQDKFNNTLNDAFRALRRFEVQSYSYQLDSDSAKKYVTTMRLLKEKGVKSGETLSDETFGEITIPGNEILKMASAFYVIIPTMEEWESSEAKITNTVYNKQVNDLEYHIFSGWKASAKCSILVIDPEGKILNTYKVFKTATSTNSDTDAVAKAFSKTVIDLTYYIRMNSSFKLRAPLGNVNGNSVFFGIGSEMEVEPGDEFVIRDRFSTGLSGRYEYKDSGLIRVKRVESGYSEGIVLMGGAGRDAQVVASPLTGVSVNIFASISPVYNKFRSISLTSLAGLNAVSNSIPEVEMALDTGFSASYEHGYGLYSLARMGINIGPLFKLYFDIGAGYNVYLGPLCLGLELNATLGFLEQDIAIMNSTIYSAQGMFVGVKPVISASFHLTQRVKLKVFGALSYYPYCDIYTYRFREAGSTNVYSMNADVADLTVDGQATNINAFAKSFDFNVGIEAVIRN